MFIRKSENFASVTEKSEIKEIYVTAMPSQKFGGLSSFYVTQFTSN